MAAATAASLQLIALITVRVWCGAGRDDYVFSVHRDGSFDPAARNWIAASAAQYVDRHPCSLPDLFCDDPVFQEVCNGYQPYGTTFGVRDIILVLSCHSDLYGRSGGC